MNPKEIVWGYGDQWQAFIKAVTKLHIRSGEFFGYLTDQYTHINDAAIWSYNSQNLSLTWPRTFYSFTRLHAQ
jgi:hypothetical protein